MAKDKTISEYTDKNKYVLKWLSAEPEQMRSAVSFEIDFDRRLDTILNALQKAEHANVIRLKPRKK